MFVIVKSGPDTQDGKRGVKLARDMAADICLIQNAVYFAQKERLEGFCGKVYILDKDAGLRGLKDDELEKGIKKIDYDGLVELMAGEDKVVGMF
jgi:sulfur relay protein TusB/DsrH